MGGQSGSAAASHACEPALTPANNQPADPGMSPQAASPAIDPDFYRNTYRSVLGDADPALHYFAEGAKEGFLPSEEFDPLAYAFLTPGVPPLHALAHARLVSGTATATAADVMAVLPRNFRRIRGLARQSGRSLEDNPKADKIIAVAHEDRAAAAHFGKPFDVPLVNDGEAPFYRMVAPAAADMWATLRRDEPYIFVKLPHSFWDRYSYAMALASRLAERSEVALFSPRQVKRLARRLYGAMADHRLGAPFLSDHFYEDVFAAAEVVAGRDDINVGLALKGYPNAVGIADEVREAFASKSRQGRHIRKIFPAGRTFIDGTVWKRWAISGDLSDLPDAIAGRPKVLVVSELFRGVDQDLGLDDCTFVEIPGEASHFIRHEILERVAAALTELRTRTRPPVVIAQAGGSLTFWLLTELHKRVPEAAFLDVGQSVDIWRLGAARKLPWIRTYFDQIVENNDLVAHYGAGRLQEIRDELEPY